MASVRILRQDIVLEMDLGNLLSQQIHGLGKDLLPAFRKFRVDEVHRVKYYSDIGRRDFVQNAAGPPGTPDGVLIHRLYGQNDSKLLRIGHSLREILSENNIGLFTPNGLPVAAVILSVGSPCLRPQNSCPEKRGKAGISLILFQNALHVPFIGIGKVQIISDDCHVQTGLFEAVPQIHGIAWCKRFHIRRKSGNLGKSDVDTGKALGFHPGKPLRKRGS